MSSNRYAICLKVISGSVHIIRHEERDIAIAFVVSNSNRINKSGYGITVIGFGTRLQSHNYRYSLGNSCLDNYFFLSALFDKFYRAVGDLDYTTVVVQLAGYLHRVTLAKFQTLSTIAVVGLEDLVTASHLKGVLAIVVDSIRTFKATEYAEYVIRIVLVIQRTSFFQRLANRYFNCIYLYSCTLEDNNVTIFNLRSVVVVKNLTGKSNLVAYVQRFVSGQVAPVTLQGLLGTFDIIHVERLLVDRRIGTRGADSTVGVGNVTGNDVHVSSFVTCLRRHSGSSLSTCHRNRFLSVD